MNRINTILFPTDFSRCSITALDYIKDMAKRNKSKIIVLHVIEGLDELTHFPLPEKTVVDLEKERFALSRKKLKEFARKTLGTFKNVVTGVAEGKPYQVIVDVARKRKVDMIIMGTHGRGGLTGFLMGSNALKVVKTAPCPVLTVKGN